MAVYVECPSCHRKQSLENNRCRACDFDIHSREAQSTWGIEPETFKFREGHTLQVYAIPVSKPVDPLQEISSLFGILPISPFLMTDDPFSASRLQASVED